MPNLLLKHLPPLSCLQESAQVFPELDPTATEAFLHLLRASDDAFAATEKYLTSHNITQGRFCVMMLLWRGVRPDAAKLMGSDTCTGGPRTPAELADAAGVTRATMTGLIDTLERDGFVKREPDPVDRRVVSVLLTEKAEQFLSDFLPGHFKVTASVMSLLDESERETFVKLLMKIQARAAELNAPVAPLVETQPV
ncbi:MarR family winged helix-turn-helix transcriptional regulator [Oleiharenicola lentus]|uniref:MarR family winged helix-turn-helix transcriptional regulator n=1 Tax=Oleiharenicola lentus TaxID=2508720 RepID=UPI003F670134